MRAVKEDNPWTERTGNPVMFWSVPELNNAGAGATVDRMVTACKDDRVFEMGVSIMPRVIEVMGQGKVRVCSRGVQVQPMFMKRPSVCRYRDSI